MDYRIIGDDGREYGPADLDTLRQWAAQGRVSPLTMVKRSDAGRWAHAENCAELEGCLPKAAPQPPAPDPATWQAQPSIGVGVPPASAPAGVPNVSGASPAFPLPGRGSTILALGLISLLTATVFSCGCLGIFVSPATGIPAWIMGAGDLRKIGEGFISPSERANTKGGMICGIIGTFFGPIAGIGIWILYVFGFVASLLSQ